MDIPSSSDPAKYITISFTAYLIAPASMAERGIERLVEIVTSELSSEDAFNSIEIAPALDATEDDVDPSLWSDSPSLNEEHP